MGRSKSKQRGDAAANAARERFAPERGPAPAVRSLSQFWLAVLLAAALACATLVLYWPVLGHGFVDFDDPLYVTENPHVLEGLNAGTFVWAWTSLEEANWHPLAWISHLVDSSLYGCAPDGAWGHHLSSLLLHAFNSALALLVLRAYTGRLWLSALVAALFAWHPLHVESVAWISERKDVLSATFFWLTLAAYLAYTRQTSSWGRWGQVVVLFALGLSAKPMLVTLPFVLLLLDYWPLGRWKLADAGKWSDSIRSGWGLLLEKSPLFVLVAASCVVTYVAQSRWGAVARIENIPLGVRIQNASVAYLAYLEKCFWPKGLVILYPYPVGGIAWPRVAMALCVISALTIVAFGLVWSRRPRGGWFSVGWFWYLGMLVPVIGLVQVGSQAMADRYTYLPLVGIFLIVAWGLGAIATQWPGVRIPISTAAVAALIACWPITRAQIGYWQDRITLYRHATATTLANFTAHSNLGHALFETALQRGDRAGVEQAIEQFRLALASNPNLAQARDGLGGCYSALGEYAAAEEEYRAAQRLAPREAKTTNNLAWLLATCPEARLRRPEEAVGLAQSACERTANLDPALLDTLAAAYAANGAWSEAVATADRAIELANRQNQTVLAEGIRARSELYRQQQVYVDQAPVWP